MMLGLTTIFVTHDQREALSMSNKIVVMKDGRKQQEGPPEEVYNYPANHFVADFLGHSNFFGGVVIGREKEGVRIKVDDGNELLVKHPGEWNDGERIELVVRAQKLDIYAQGELPPEPEVNVFHGHIKERSYMGGEISYFVELENGTILHVIHMIKSKPIARGEKVSIQVLPEHCGLLRKENGS
jgi:putative spermidine/putrescine transport system ATP-binding protein/spermidine/putrescine transport system ATP-binding protein